MGPSDAVLRAQETIQYLYRIQLVIERWLEVIG